MEPAPIGAAKDGAAGSVIVAKRAATVGCSGAPVVRLLPSSSFAAAATGLEAAAVFAQQGYAIR